MSEPLLELKKVSMRFPVHGLHRERLFVHAMDDVSFSLKKGEILSLVGESGSGKTTTAKVIARLHKPYKGEVIFRGKDIFGAYYKKETLLYRKEVQMIFQDPFGSLNPTHTIRALMERPFLIHKMAGRKNVVEEIRKVLNEVGLEPPEQYMKKYPHELSGGQRQRVNIARVISVRPLLLLADEPTSMLDVSIRMIVMNMIKKFRDEQMVTYLYITHDLASARYISDRIAVMYAGMIQEIGKADDVIQQALHPYTQLLRSAAPAPEKGFRKGRLITKGDIPGLIKPPTGCRFHPRCPYVEPECSKEIPEPVMVKEGHFVRCFRYS